MLPVSWRLVCLWIAHLAHCLADCSVGLFLARDLRIQTNIDSLIWGFLVFWIIPRLIVGTVLQIMKKPDPSAWFLVGAAAISFSFLLFGFGMPIGDPRIILWIMWLASALFEYSCSSLLLNMSRKTSLSLTRLNGWFALNTALGISGGFLLDYHLMDWEFAYFCSVLIIGVGLYLISLLCVLPVPGITPKAKTSNPPGSATNYNARAGETFACWLGLCCLWSLITFLIFCWLARRWERGVDESNLEFLVHLMVWLGSGFAIGSLLAGWQKHSYRVHGLVPWGATGFAACLVYWPLDYFHGPYFFLFLGLTAALVHVPLLTLLQENLPLDAPGKGLPLLGKYMGIVLGVGGVYLLPHQGGELQIYKYAWLPAALALLLAALSWWFFFREVIEQMSEILLVPICRIHGTGPGLAAFPRQGPVLVVANHSAWFDPLWLGKVVPRRSIPMMTSLFFDKPGLRWLMVNVVHAIRVEYSTFRREVPEIQEAITNLDRGEVVVIFPEGGMRRHENQPLKQFGQGIWHILQQRPQTPVVVCWIEGGWGSFFSYFNGLPTKNKSFDFWRSIRVAVEVPQVVPLDILADHRTTRTYLMQSCLQARKHLGLEPYTLENKNTKDEDPDGSPPP